MVCAMCNGVFDRIIDGRCPVCKRLVEVAHDAESAKASMVSLIPSIADVADQGASSVQQVSPVVELTNRLKQQRTDGIAITEPKRQPVDHMTANLYWPFIIMMGRIAKYAQDKYGSVEQYADGRLEGEKSPINHIAGHVADYVQRRPHDKFGNLQMQLAAIAYNAMMECVYLDQGGGPTIPATLYTRGAE